MMDMILCPTRGGTAAYPNQDRAIALAIERKAKLIFLYISNVEFLGHTALPKLVDLEAELDEMGEFLLCMAQERAKKAGVEADTLVKRGDFSQALKEVLEALPITAVVLGSSPHGVGALPPDFIQKLGEELSRDNGVEFIVTHKGKIIQTYFQDNDEN